MRARTLLKNLLGVKGMTVVDFQAEDGDLVLDVRPTWRKPRCWCSDAPRSTYDTQAPRRWRCLDFGGVRGWLRYAPRRVACPKCGVVVEHVPWAAAPRGGFTRDFEQASALLAQRTDKSTVVQLMGISWATVGRIVDRVVTRLRPGDPLDHLRRIGVDELSFRKGHKYLTLVTNHDTGHIVWAAEGKSGATLEQFFDELGEQRCKLIEVVSMDMSAAYISATQARLPNAQIVFDRFHIQKLVNEALDETRRVEWQRARKESPGDAKAVKGLRWALVKSPWNLTAGQRQRLSTLRRDNGRLYRAYLMKEAFRDILDRHQPNLVKAKLKEWTSWASRSRLPAFVRVARTIRAHLDNIVAYIRCRVTNGLVEGINNRARVVIRRAFGFHAASAFIAMIMLCCTGLWLCPVRNKLAP